MMVLVCRAGDEAIINGSPFFVCKSTPNSFIAFYSFNIDLSFILDVQLLLVLSFIFNFTTSPSKDEGRKYFKKRIYSERI